MNSNQVTVILKLGREKPVGHGHPWIFSGGIDAIQGDPVTGAVAEVVGRDGTWLARGLLHPAAALAVRLYTRRQDQPLDAAFFAARLDTAVAMREQLFGDAETQGKTNAYRLVFSESDGLSGLIVDRYADALAVQVGAAGLLPYLPDMLEHLRRRTGISQVHVSADPDDLMREQFDASALPSSIPPDAPVRIKENGFLFDVDLHAGQKTGFFLDQRVNRQRVAAYARGRRMLSAYCYTGAFEVHAAAAGATEVVGLDRSEGALAMARKGHELNGTTVPTDYARADVPEALRRFRDAGRTFDLIVLDPPRFVASREQVTKGLRAYKDINLLAMKLLTSGGILATFSCSGQISMADFKTMIGWASNDTGRSVRILEILSQPPDHPILAVVPESEYLKGLICWVE
ncbi:MAG: class I SAM-dependent rRNA methyltransferase [Verrucomicrobiota bacterium]